MASRTISTRIVIEGESEYKRSIANINSALGVLKSELSAVKTEYNSNANSMEALRAKGEVMARVHDAQAGKLKAVAAALENAKRGQQEYAAKVEAANQKVLAAEQRLEGMTGTSNRAKRARAELTASVEEYRKELSQAEKYNEAAQRGVNNWEKQLNNAKKSLSDLNLEIQKNDQYMGEAKKSTDGCATSIDQYGKRVKGAKDESDNSTAAVEALTSALIAGGLKMAFDEVAAAITACIDASVQFESAMAGVYKTVDGSSAQLAGISEGIRKMALEMPATTTELAGVAEAAGQLGIATDDILGFTRVMTDLGNATNLSSNEAATTFARFANITGMAAEDYSRLGSSLVALGNNFATTEAEIAAMATRLAAAGSMSGLTEAEIMAVATALSSVGLEAEAGGTAFSKLMKQFEVMVVTGSDKLSSFASVAGMSAQQFSEAWKADAVGTLSQFISGLGKLDAAGGSSVAVLEELGITEARMSDAVTRLAGAGDLLTRSVQASTQAWQENSALTDEVAKRYETTESKLAILGNAFGELKISVGDVFAPAVRDAAEAGTELLTWAADVVEKYPAVVGVVAALAAALGVLTIAVAGYTVATRLIIPLVQAFNRALYNNPIGLVVFAITTAIAALTAFSTVMKGASDETKGWSKATKEAVLTHREQIAEIEESTASTERMMATLQALTAKEEKTAADKQAILGVVRELNEAVPNLSLSYDEQTDSLNMTTEALENLVRAQHEAAEIKSAQDALAALHEESIALEEEMTDALANLEAAKARFADFDGVEARTRAEETALDGAKGALMAAQGAVDKLTAAQNANEEQIAAQGGAYDKLIDTLDETTGKTGALSQKVLTLTEVLDKTQGGYELLTKAQKEVNDSGSISISTVTALLGQYPTLSKYLVETASGYVLTEGALQSYISAQRTEYQVACNDAQTAAQAIIDAENAKREATTKTTDSIREQLKTLIAFYSSAATIMRAFGSGYKNNDDFYAHGGIMAGKVAEGNARAAEAEAILAALEAADANLATFDRSSAMLGRDYGSGGGNSGGKSSSSGGGKGQTQAEKDLATYKESVAALDHARAMDEISEEDYYKRKTALAALYLKENKAERERLDEELHTWQKGAYDRDLAALDEALEEEKITWQDYLGQRQQMQNKHLKEGSDEWEDAERERKQKAQALRQDAYDEELADLKYLRDMGITSEQEHYVGLAELRDKYLEVNSEAWRSATVELNDYFEKCRKEALEAEEKAYQARIDALQDKLDQQMDAAKDAYDAQLDALEDALKTEKDTLKNGYQTEKDTLKQHYQDSKAAMKQSYQDAKDAAKDAHTAKKNQIQAELDLEKERLNTILDGIDAEVQARKELREDEDQDAVIAAAQKRLEAAQAQREYARTDEDKAQWDKEVIRLQQALEAAIQSKEDTAFYREKELEKEAVREELSAAEEAAKDAQSRAQAEYDAKLKQMEAEYNASVTKSEADYNASLFKIEADYNANLVKMEAEHAAKLAQAKRDYEAQLTRLQQNYDNAVSRLESKGNAGGGDRVPTAPDREKGAIGVPYYHEAENAATARAAAGALSAAVASMSAVTNEMTSIVHNKNASVTIAQAPSLTEGQVARAVEKVLERLDR